MKQEDIDVLDQLKGEEAKLEERNIELEELIGEWRTHSQDLLYEVQSNINHRGLDQKITIGNIIKDLHFDPQLLVYNSETEDFN